MAAVEVPSPVPPDDRDAWYAPAVHAQDAVGHNVVVTICEGADAFVYDVREPTLSVPDALACVESYVADASVQPPIRGFREAGCTSSFCPKELEMAFAS